MRQSEADRLADNLTQKFGLAIKALVNEGKEGHITLIPEGVHRNEGFSLSIQIGWRSLEIEFVLGKFAADLLRQMGESSHEKKKLFSSVAQQILKERGSLVFRINDVASQPLEFDTWPNDWKAFRFLLKKSPLEINTEDHGLTEELINLWTERFFACVIAISPLEDAEEETEVNGLPEGALKQELVNRYERSRYNRTLCINFHGLNCKVCNLNFAETYGETGRGFIHVHHITPVSQMGPGYIINPIEDLIPVCPNCHAMLHKRNPPYSSLELKELIDQASSPEVR